MTTDDTAENRVATAFADALQGEARASADRSATALATLIEQRIGEARATWPQLTVGDTDFATYLGEHIPADTTHLLEYVASLHVASLYLCCACAAGNTDAVAAFEAEHFRLVEPALRGFDKTGALVDDATQLLRKRLFVAEPDRPAKVADYAGRGDLTRWVRAAAARIGLDLVRKTQKEHNRQDDDDALAALPGLGDDPELQHIRNHYGGSLRAAFAEAIAELPAKQRTVLRYHFVDGLPIDKIGAIYQVHKTTAFRWLEAARESLVRGTRARMQNQLGVKKSELGSIMRLIQSDLHLSIRRLLSDSPAKSGD